MVRRVGGAFVMAGGTRSRLVNLLSTVQCAQVRAGFSVSRQTVINPKMSVRRSVMLFLRVTVAVAPTVSSTTGPIVTSKNIGIV